MGVADGARVALGLGRVRVTVGGTVVAVRVLVSGSAVGEGVWLAVGETAVAVLGAGVAD
jgi:hypothetical protein